jgi:hypothetical protein
MLPRIVSEALGEPDVLLTFVSLAVVSALVARAVAPRLDRPAWLVALALWSVAGIIALTTVPHGGWASLGVYPGGLQDVLACLGPDGWPRSLGALLADDGPLNVILFVPAGILWALVSGRTVATIAALAALSLAIEAWQALTGARSCTTPDVLANALGGAIGASVGLAIARVTSRGRHAG